MAIPLNVLDNISIASPCTVAWDGMEGDDRTRFCTKCSKHVHDISELTAAQAIQLLNVTEELPCVRLYRRPDGRVVTSDCPVSLRERAWKWLGQRSAWAASVFAMVFLTGCGRSDQGAVCFHTTEKTAEAPPEILPMPRERSVAPMPHEPTQSKPGTAQSTEK